ncbi:predicted protein [Chaetomium globosum CBS 148.51]|uniref:2EXR domain-containing protein n=1 Tax=Chaetomium globosum (strain ATCC 6205 / CBS 148.51 / DSM 1962 / NBRC 6347 / NRRL 1970) TaxID=306901 RepID=Q2HF23_CHAGB|nr:uncharacterized protein CHGG_01181 [Chaetomium globosum CBS 148.51]EAQ92946.1 predicted protein [Chaetomium globosum CBS 148.51]
MQEKLTIIDVPWHRQPLGVLTSQSAFSPSGRPYSPYPYRDLPKTPSEWPSHARNAKSTPAETQQSHGGSFHLFSYLPAELRLQIWREAMLSACSHGRVHRVHLAITDAEPSSLEPNNNPTLHILPTPDLAASTRTTRALLASCSEARYELLSLKTTTTTTTSTITSTTLPDTLPLSLPATQTNPNSPPKPAGLLRLNLTHDMLLLHSLTSTLLFALADARHAHPALLAPLRGVRHVGLDVAPLLDEAEGCAFLFPGAAVPPEVESALVGLAMRFLCQFRQAMDAPAVVTDLDDEAALERLEDVKLRLLGHYVTREAGAETEGWELSSPEKCLEVALGKEPRWVQWEWVCQCLNC